MKRNYKFDSLEKAVNATLIAVWKSGNGGISDSKFEQIAVRLEKENGYSFDEIEEEFEKQMEKAVQENGKQQEEAVDNKKIADTIENKLGVKVEKVNEVTQDGKEVIVDVKVGETSCRKVILKESKNQYGTYYRLVSASEYELKVEAEPKKAEKKSSGKLRTKTEQLCGARRQDIISFAEKTISQVADGSARIKEIEGAALENTVIRFVLLMNGDDSRFKEDIAVSTIREALVEA